MRAIAIVLLCAGCGPSGTSPVALSWQLADGRDCASSGVDKIAVARDGASTQRFACADGLAPAAVTLVLPRAGATLAVDGESPDGTALYAGTLALDTLPSTATVTLYAAAMR